MRGFAIVSRSSVLASLLIVIICARAYVGEVKVCVETSNQHGRYLSRPFGLTASYDDSIRDVAQQICDKVKPGSTAKIIFVGKIPGLGLLYLSDLGRYRYDFESAPVTASTQPTMVADPPSTSAQPENKQNLNLHGTHQRKCVLQQVKYHRCIGDCIVKSTSATQAIARRC